MIDYIELATMIRSMKPRSKMFKFLRTEIDKLGYWKNKARGNPSKGWKLGFGKNRSVD